MQKIQNRFKIVANERISPGFCRLRLDAKAVAAAARPGQFIHIKVSQGLLPFFRRPFSIHRAKKHLEILYEVLGEGTQALVLRKPGEYLDVLGPLGNHFNLPPKGTRQVVMVAGGVGVAPFLSLSDELAGRGCKSVLLYGGRSKNYIFGINEFKKNGCEVFVATDDGSAGTKGKVSVLFSKINPDIRATVLYACGPRPMMAALQRFAQKNDFYGEASCEEVMACGLGACLGCSIKTTEGYKTTCHDGPVFNIKEIIF